MQNSLNGLELTLHDDVRLITQWCADLDHPIKARLSGDSFKVQLLFNGGQLTNVQSVDTDLLSVCGFLYNTLEVLTLPWGGNNSSIPDEFTLTICLEPNYQKIIKDGSFEYHDNWLQTALTTPELWRYISIYYDDISPAFSEVQTHYLKHLITEKGIQDRDVVNVCPTINSCLNYIKAYSTTNIFQLFPELKIRLYQ